MSSEEDENEQDYAVASHQGVPDNNNTSDDDFEIPVTRRSRRNFTILINNGGAQIRYNDVEPSTSSAAAVNATNTDHNYVTEEQPVVGAGTSGMSNSTISAMEGDQDIFQEDDDQEEENDDDVVYRRRRIINVIATESISSTSTISTPSRSGSESELTDIISAPSSSVEIMSTSSLSSTSSTSSLNAILVPAEEPVVAEPTAEPTAEPATGSNAVVAAALQAQLRNNNESIINLDSPSPAKKRKRLSLEATQKSGTPKVKSNNNDDDDEDDGLTCPICLDTWEMSGEHRLASLKCGHLFGDSCIRRWLQESSRQSGQKVCPQCKTKAHPKEIRFLYAKRLRAIDRSEEHRMRDQLNAERSRAQNLELELATAKMSYAQVQQKLKNLEADNDTLNLLLRNGGGGAGGIGTLTHSSANAALKHSVLYKLFMDRNIEISREPGCRVMKYSEVQAALLVSQRSSQGLFPGYGIRFLDTVSFKPTNFLFASIKLLRDISLSVDQQLLVAASMEPKVKLFDLRTLQVASTFNPREKPLWSCAIGQKHNENSLYLGSQQGTTYVYDIRFPERLINEYFTEGDMSPVIQVASVPANELFPHGGFLVCKLTSLWFYEHTTSVGTPANATRLALEGRFISMDFDATHQNLVVQTRSCAREPRARYIFGRLIKIQNIPHFEIKVTFFATTNSPVMARCSQIAVDSNTLVAAYIQDTKLLTLFDARREQRVQSLPAQDIIYDTCPIYTKGCTFLAALTETKCRLYKLNSQPKNDNYL